MALAGRASGGAAGEAETPATGLGFARPQTYNPTQPYRFLSVVSGMWSDVLPILVYVAMGATAAVLFAGIFTMLKGGKVSKRHSNRLMRMRVALQALAIALLAILFFVVKKSP